MKHIINDCLNYREERSKHHIPDRFLEAVVNNELHLSNLIQYLKDINEFNVIYNTYKINLVSS